MGSLLQFDRSPTGIPEDIPGARSEGGGSAVGMALYITAWDVYLRNHSP
jgi:hypothetical protein